MSKTSLPDATVVALFTARSRAVTLFVSCTVLSVPGLIPGIEAARGKPVIGSNRALGCAMRRAAGWRATKQGSLFAVEPAPV